MTADERQVVPLFITSVQRDRTNKHPGGVHSGVDKGSLISYQSLKSEGHHGCRGITDDVTRIHFHRCTQGISKLHS